MNDTAHTSMAPAGRGPQRRDLMSALRGAIAKIERKHASLDEAAPLLPFGVAEIDDVLGGGLAPAALHEIAATGEAEIAAATGFTLALACRAPARAVLWIAEEMTACESGTPYGPGLDEIGLAPERLVTVTATHARDVLWAMEEALRCRAVGAVIGELRSERGVGDVAVRRLSLAATERGGLALLLRTAPSAEATPADTRWIVGPAASASTQHGIGPPAFAVQLVRNRRGVLGSWMLEWNCVDQCFQLASTHPQSLAAPALDRSAGKAVA
jgi:protein ImuA